MVYVRVSEEFRKRILENFRGKSHSKLHHYNEIIISAYIIFQIRISLHVSRNKRRKTWTSGQKDKQEIKLKSIATTRKSS